MKSSDPMLEGLTDIEKLAHTSINEWYFNKGGLVSAETEVRCMTFNQFYNRLVDFGRKVAGAEFEDGYRKGQKAATAELEITLCALADTKRMLNDCLAKAVQSPAVAGDRERALEAALMRFALLGTSDGPGILAGDDVLEGISIRAGDIRDARELLGLPRGMYWDELKAKRAELKWNAFKPFAAPDSPAK
jgi:hypothetical protein